jgi:hypothetical protein
MVKYVFAIVEAKRVVSNVKASSVSLCLLMCALSRAVSSIAVDGTWLRCTVCGLSHGCGLHTKV